MTRRRSSLTHRRGRSSRAAFVVLAVVMVGCADRPVVDVPVHWRVAVEPSTDAARFEVEVLGGGCDLEDEQFASVAVAESQEEVRVAAFVRKPDPEAPGEACTSAGRSHTAIVELDEPLGDRRLTDALCVDDRRICDGDRIDG